jgi:AraC-like DNA-binding protein
MRAGIGMHEAREARIHTTSSPAKNWADAAKPARLQSAKVGVSPTLMAESSVRGGRTMAAVKTSAPSIRAPRLDPSARTVSAIFAQAYLMFGVKHGFDPQEMCAAAGVRPSDIADRESQIPYAWADALGRQLIERLPHLSVGIELGQFSSIDQLGYLGQALRNCGTPLEALSLLARSARLLDSAYRHATLVVQTSDRIEFHTPVLTPAEPAEWIEMGFVNIVKGLRTLGGVVAPREVRFAHDRDAALRARLAELFACPVHFHSTGNALVFDRAVMERTVAGADSAACAHFGAHVGKMLDRLEEPFITVVTRAIESLLGRDDSSQARVAKLLGLSTRSLRRTLRDHGESFAQLLAQARRSRAEVLLAGRTLAVYEVAFALGYDDVSAFTRAFRQWTGQSPREFREARAHSRAGGAALTRARSDSR